MALKLPENIADKEIFADVFKNLSEITKSNFVNEITMDFVSGVNGE